VDVLAIFVFGAAIATAPVPGDKPDLDASLEAAEVDLDSPQMKAQVLAAMSWPYKYGVTQMPWKAQAMQPQRGWHPAREPAGRILWVEGPTTKVFWTGIYGTCLIQAPGPKMSVPEPERTALKCECNGWLPRR